MYEDIYDVRDVARKLNVSLPTVYQWIRTGRLHPTTVKTRSGSVYGIRDTDLHEFMKRNRRYAVYSYEEEREINGITKGGLGRLNEALAKLHEARDSIDQDIRNLERLIETFDE